MYHLALYRKSLTNREAQVASGKETTYQCLRHKRCESSAWVRKIP